jgi:hypothetical protein
MTTKSEKNGSNTTTVTTNTKCKRTAESKFTEEPQNKEISSDSGQAYFNVDNSPFAIVRYEGAYRIILGKDIVSDQKFPNAKAARDFIKREKWTLTWAMCIWVMMHAEELKSKAALNQKKDEQ